MTVLEKIKDRVIAFDDDLLKALKQMDLIQHKLLFVFKDMKFVNLISVGDIQRSIIANKPLSTPVGSVVRENILFANAKDSFNEIKEKMLDHRTECMPVLDDERRLVNVYFWEDLFSDKESQPITKFNLPVIIMAGGFGTRLKPLTNVLPKPLIPIGEKTMLEEIFDRFGKHGCDHYYISVNYKAELIEFYLESQNLPYQIEFFKEDKPMGTAGSLSLLKGKIHQTFFINNCDILIEQDYSEILSYHKANKNEITLVAALKSYTIPYGTLETGNDGELLEIREKPDFTFKINSGMYILEPHLLDEIPENEFFHITHLIDKVSKRGGRVGVFPVSEKSWKDIGNWKEYISNLT